MNRFLIAFLLIFSTQALTEAASPKNVVLLISDNQNYDDLGCYGNTAIKTPNIDALASNGTRFNNAFATTASCGPSRAVIYTGQFTHQNGQYGHPHGIHTFRLQPKVQTIFQMLQAKGYQTALLGKKHVSPEERYPFSFDRRGGGYYVAQIADHADIFIKESEEKPFFLVVGYQDPHPTSRTHPEWGIKRKEKGVVPVQYDPKNVIVPRYLPDNPEVRERLAGYYQQISRMDYGVGRILDLLKKYKKDENTLVIFTSDHGSSEPGAMANHYEPGVHVPLIVKDPTTKQNSTSNALTTLADIVPSILDWTDTRPEKLKLASKSFISRLTNDDTTGWKETYLSHVNHEATMYYPMRTIRTDRYKLIWNLVWQSEYPLPIDTLNRHTWNAALKRNDGMIGRRTIDKFLFRDQVEMYDLKSDPDEIKNLAYEPKFAAVRDELSKKLNQWMVDTNDPWLERHRLPMSNEPDSASSRQRVRVPISN